MPRIKSAYKPLLFTTTVRTPQRTKGLLNILSQFNNRVLDDELAETIMGELVRYGLYRPRKQLESVKEKWSDTKKGEFSTRLLTNDEVEQMLENNPQNHKEAGFKKGWPSRFATEYDFDKELGFVYYSPGEKIIFSEIGLKLASTIKIEVEGDTILVSEEFPELERQAFLHALAKYQRNNPFVRVLNDNVPLVLLLQVIKKLNNDKELRGNGISKLELPLLLFWKDNNSEELYQLIKQIRKKYGCKPSWEVIIDICINEIMNGKFKKFKPKSIMVEYPDEFIRKMRLTRLISLRGGGSFIDINKNDQEIVDYILDHYSKYPKFSTEKEYFDYMASIDKNLIIPEKKTASLEEKNILLTKWVGIYPWEKIKEELVILTKKGLTKDDILKYLSSSVRLEFLVALAIKSKFPGVKVIPNYPSDDEGLPTSTAGGIGDKGDIECFENVKGILVEVTMSEGASQTKMEVWPITRHLEEFGKKLENSMCYFVAPSIFIDTERQIKFVKKEEGLNIIPKTIEQFLEHIDGCTTLYPNC